jgi:uncharacterized membrane protein
MSERAARAATALFALAGLGIASYLSYTHATDVPIMCPTSGCGAVQRSAYSELAGIPVAYLGVLGYAAIVATTVTRRPEARTAGAVLVIVASGFAIYLVVAQLALIHAVCTWCMASEVATFVLAGLTVWRLRSAARRSTPV